MRWSCVFCLLAVLSAGVAHSVERDEDGWKIYRNEKFGYELAYPPGMEYTEFVDGSSGELKDAATGNRLISFEVWPPGECPRQPDSTTAKEIGIERAKTVTHSDGPDGSSYCGDPVKAREFASSLGIEIFELELTCMREVFPVRDEEAGGQAAPTAEAQSRITVEGKKGPTYFADISQPWRKRILLADPVILNRFSPVTAKRQLDPAVLRQILDTLKKFAIPKPQGICIEDLQNRTR